MFGHDAVSLTQVFSACFHAQMEGLPVSAVGCTSETSETSEIEICARWNDVIICPICQSEIYHRGGERQARYVCDRRSILITYCEYVITELSLV